MHDSFDQPAQPVSQPSQAQPSPALSPRSITGSVPDTMSVANVDDAEAAKAASVCASCSDVRVLSVGESMMTIATCDDAPVPVPAPACSSMRKVPPAIPLTLPLSLSLSPSLALPLSLNAPPSSIRAVPPLVPEGVVDDAEITALIATRVASMPSERATDSRSICLKPTAPTVATSASRRICSSTPFGLPVGDGAGVVVAGLALHTKFDGAKPGGHEATHPV